MFAQLSRGGSRNMIARTGAPMQRVVPEFSREWRAICGESSLQLGRDLSRRVAALGAIDPLCGTTVMGECHVGDLDARRVVEID
jgi:hypothetical protein